MPQIQSLRLLLLMLRLCPWAHARGSCLSWQGQQDESEPGVVGHEHGDSKRTSQKAKHTYAHARARVRKLMRSQAFTLPAILDYILSISTVLLISQASLHKAKAKEAGKKSGWL